MYDAEVRKNEITSLYKIFHLWSFLIILFQNFSPLGNRTLLVMTHLRIQILIFLIVIFVFSLLPCPFSLVKQWLVMADVRGADIRVSGCDNETS